VKFKAATLLLNCTQGLSSPLSHNPYLKTGLLGIKRPIIFQSSLGSLPAGVLQTTIRTTGFSAETF
jgi:hypothetical protein